MRRRRRRRRRAVLLATVGVATSLGASVLLAGDRGMLAGAGGAVVAVEDVQKIASGKIFLHKGTVTEGVLSGEEEVAAAVANQQQQAPRQRARSFLSDAATEHPPRRLLLQDLPQLPPAAASAVSLLLDLRRRIWPYFRDEDLGAGTGGLFAADRQLNAYFSVLLNLWNAVFGVQGLRLTPFGDLPTFTLYAPWLRVGGGGLAYDFVRQLFVDSSDMIAIVFNVVIGPVLGGISMPSVLNVELFDEVGFEEIGVELEPCDGPGGACSLFPPEWAAFNLIDVDVFDRSFLSYVEDLYLAVSV